MKHYKGDRTIDGIEVLADEQPLDQQLAVAQYTDQGFEWSYEGAEPQQLALALLVDHLGDPEQAKKLCEPFMKAVVARLDNTWSLTANDIDQALAQLEN
jgi:hypothetical protein